ncbi:hypothetical protein BJY00DRAFT_306626 [Aspergillus carlsbadensis]|nr:hypothetical protein BJY00DRAFT_306626 [Aspergillus carlsbadensis]
MNQADPPIERSISQRALDIFKMGSRFLCRKVQRTKVTSSITSWEDRNGSFCLLNNNSELSLSEQPLRDLLYQAGTSSAVWAIGSNAICKVKTWTDGMEMESNTLAFVKANFPDIPVPDIIYTWLDEKLSRSFLILKRVQGNTLAQVWPSLTPEKRNGIASTIAQFCYKLTNLTSNKVQSATGHGVLEPFMNVRAKDSRPSYLQRISRIYKPPVTTTFHFYHADLGPTNLLISDNGKIKAILDWESAGFYRKY